MIQDNPRQELKQFIKNLAFQANFSAVYFTKPTINSRVKQGFMEFIAKKYHGEMAWLGENIGIRFAPEELMPNAQTMIIFGYEYTAKQSSLDFLANKNNSVMASYALGPDYHDIIKAKLVVIARELFQKFAINARNFVDTAPILEKPLAMQAGLGWQGKHTNLVSRQLGNFFFIACMLIDAECESDEAEGNHCGSCQACINICPTQAFDAPYQLNATKCISYLTIEHKSHIPREYRAKIGNRIYGCDDCLAICPWNKFAHQAHEFAKLGNPDWQSESLAALVILNNEEFHAKYRKTPIKRIGRARFIRNILIAIGNSKNPEFLAKILPLLEDESPLIKVACVWAIKQILGHEQALTHRIHDENQEVNAEWVQAY